MENSKNGPEVTIAIPFYNAERYLSQAIDSVMNQTYQNWCLLLLDDGSTDGSLAIANKYRNDSRVTIYSDGENKNLGYRLNQIPTLANTKYIARMDADDIMHPSRIEKQLKALEENPQIDVLGTNAYSIDQDSKIIGIRISNPEIPKIIGTKGFIHPTIIAKKSWFLANPYDVAAVRIEDAELWLRTNKTSTFKVITEPLLYYREFGDHYYKKYFKAWPKLSYIVNKHKFSYQVVKFAGRYIIASLRCYFYFLINKENEMIKKRNKIVF